MSKEHGKLTYTFWHVVGSAICVLLKIQFPFHLYSVDESGPSQEVLPNFQGASLGGSTEPCLQICLWQLERKFWDALPFWLWFKKDIQLHFLLVCLTTSLPEFFRNVQRRAEISAEGAVQVFMITIYRGTFENSYSKPDDLVTFTHRMVSTRVVGPLACGPETTQPKMMQADLNLSYSSWSSSPQ